jgi:hypothetical protein
MIMPSMTRRVDFDAPVFFIRTEIELGLTFASIAAHSSNEEKFKRNQRNTQRAYDTARHFISLIELSDDQAAALSEMLAELEHRLRLLGSFAPQLA